MENRIKAYMVRMAGEEELAINVLNYEMEGKTIQTHIKEMMEKLGGDNSAILRLATLIVLQKMVIDMN